MSIYNYKVCCPVYMDVNNRKFLRGDTVRTSQKLDEIFLNKFQLIEAPVVSAGTVAEQHQSGYVPPIEEEKRPRSEKTVTEDFPLAKEFGLAVVAKGPWMFIYDSDDLNTPLNEKGIKAEAVNTFIETYQG